MTLYCYKLEF